MSDLDQLWDRAPGGIISWYDTLDGEQRAFIDEVAALCREKGRYPVWSAVWRAFRSKWPSDAPSTSTISATIRRLANL